MRNVEMKNIIIGTAGHIDHGKTALVRALTGIDTDRLKEEKQRGISIDLGFAHWEASDNVRFVRQLCLTCQCVGPGVISYPQPNGHPCPR